jgi:hypothetical protein
MQHLALHVRRLALLTVALALSPRAAQSESGPCPPPDPAALRPVPFGPSGDIMDPRPVFAWQPVPGYDEFVLKLLDADAGEYVTPPGRLAEVEHATNWQPPSDLPMNRQMRWAVKVYCDTPGGGKGYGLYSAQRFFTIVPRPPEPIFPLGCTPTTRPTFTWLASAGATGYWLLVSDKWDFGSPDAHWLVNAVVPKTAFKSPVAFPRGPTYYWKVKSIFSDHPGSWSMAGSFEARQACSGGVVFFPDIDFGGAASQFLPKGTYTRAQLQARGLSNDAASSVRISAGTTLTMFQNDKFKGASWTLTQDTLDFRNLSPNANDQVSSCVIR